MLLPRSTEPTTASPSTVLSTVLSSEFTTRAAEAALASASVVLPSHGRALVEPATRAGTGQRARSAVDDQQPHVHHERSPLLSAAVEASSLVVLSLASSSEAPARRALLVRSLLLELALVVEPALLRGRPAVVALLLLVVVAGELLLDLVDESHACVWCGSERRLVVWRREKGRRGSGSCMCGGWLCLMTMRGAREGAQQPLTSLTGLRVGVRTQVSATS